MPPVRLEARQLDHLALGTVRSFLRRLAQMLESSSEEPVGRYQALAGRRADLHCECAPYNSTPQTAEVYNPGVTSALR